MTSNDENHGQSLDPRDALQPQGIVLFGGNNFLHVVDDGKRDDKGLDNGLLVFAPIDDVDFKNGAEQQDGDEEKNNRPEIQKIK